MTRICTNGQGISACGTGALSTGGGTVGQVRALSKLLRPHLLRREKSDVETLKLERSEIGLRLERKTSQHDLVLRQQEFPSRMFCRHVETCTQLANIEPVQNIDHLMR